MRHPFLWLVLGITLGATAMHLLRGEAAPEPPRPDLGKTSEARETEKEPDRPKPYREIRTTSDPTAAAVRRSIDDLVANLPVPNNEPGKGRIEGRVLDENGNGLEGVLVRATPVPDRETHLQFSRKMQPWRRWDLPTERGLAPRIHEIIAFDLWNQTERREARSDAEGRFVLDGLFDRRYQIEAWMRGWDISKAPDSPGLARIGRTVNLVASRLIDVEFEVKLPDGTPAIDALIEISMNSRQLGQSPVPYAGERLAVPLSPGTYTFRATLAHPVEMRSELTNFVAVRGNDPEVVSLHLTPHLKISGHLRFTEAPPPRQFLVTSRPLKEGQSAEDLPKLARRSPFNDPYSTGSGPSPFNDFFYVLTDLEAGRHVVDVRFLGADEPLLTREVVIEDAAVELDLEIATIDLGQRVEFRLLGPGDTEITDATVMIQGSTQGQLRTVERAHPERLEDGTLVHVANLRSAARHDPWTILAKSNHYGALLEQAHLAGASERTLRFAAPATLRVTVPGARENPERSRITVYLQPYESFESDLAGGFSTELTACDGDDALQFGPLQPGRYWLSAHFASETYHQPVIGEAEVRLASGVNHQVLALAKMQSVTLLFPGERAGQIAHLRAEQGVGFSTEQPIPPSGRVTFTGLTEGRYFAYDGYLTDASVMEITIPGPEEIRFTGQRVNALRVLLTDEDGLFQRAGLKDGDLIVGVGAGDIGANPMAAVLAPLMSGAEVSCTIVRGGRERTLKVKLDLGLTGELGLGGEFLLVARPR